MRHLTDTATDPPQLKRGPDRRTLALIFAFVGAACLFTASFSKSWMGNDRFGGRVRDRDGRVTDAGGRYFKFLGDIRFGPLGFEHCMPAEMAGFGFGSMPEGGCRTLSNKEFNAEVAEAAHMDRDKYTSGAFSPAGWLAFATCLLSALGLLASAGLVLARKRPELPVSPASVALLGIMGAMASGCVFIATKPGPAGMLGVDLGFWAFGAGTVIGILGAQMIAKELRPADPDLLEDALRPEDFAALGRGPERYAPPGLVAPAVEVPATQPVDVLALLPPGEAGSAAAAASAAAAVAAVESAEAAAAVEPPDAPAEADSQSEPRKPGDESA